MGTKSHAWILDGMNSALIEIKEAEVLNEIVFLQFAQIQTPQGPQWRYLAINHSYFKNKDWYNELARSVHDVINPYLLMHLEGYTFEHNVRVDHLNKVELIR